MSRPPPGDALPPADTLAALDLLDRVQLAEVVRIARAARLLCRDARTLFSVSRARRGTPNDADRLRKYLLRFGIDPSSLFD